MAVGIMKVRQPKQIKQIKQPLAHMVASQHNIPSQAQTGEKDNPAQTEGPIVRQLSWHMRAQGQTQEPPLSPHRHS